MVRRVCRGLGNKRSIIVINDEAHHCYRAKPDEQAAKLKGEERKEAEKNNEAARLWITGLETVSRTLGLTRVIDLSATPFFLRGSGYVEGTLFPWTMSDFSLMDAIECGIVKLPRVPVADNIPGGEMPMFRNLWEHIRARMPKKGRGKSDFLDPRNLPPQLQTALDALYGHYAQTFALWAKDGLRVPPCFIIVCNNTATSKLVFDYIAGFHLPGDDDGPGHFVAGRLPLFRNFDDHGNPLPRPRTLLIDSEQARIRRCPGRQFSQDGRPGDRALPPEIIERTGDLRAADTLTDQAILREEVIQTRSARKTASAKSIRCVVSVSMLTEGWDANTVTHVLGVRALAPNCSASR